MKSLPAVEAKNNFGRLLDMAHAGPVMIEKHGRSVAVVLSVEEYERLGGYEDAYWIALAEEGEASGYLSADESEALLKEMMSAKD